MNTVTISGTVAGDSELRTLDNGRVLLNFDVSVDGPKGKDPIIHVAYFPRENGDVQEIEAGRRVFVEGSLRHRFDTRLFVAARTIRVLDGLSNSRVEVQGKGPRTFVDERIER